MEYLSFRIRYNYVSIVKKMWPLITVVKVNPYHAEFLKWNNPPSIYETFHYHF